MALNIHDDEILGIEAYAAELELLVSGADQVCPLARFVKIHLLQCIDSGTVTGRVRKRPGLKMALIVHS